MTEKVDYKNIRDILNSRGIDILEDGLKRRGILADFFCDDRMKIDLLDKVMSSSNISYIRDLCKNYKDKSDEVELFNKKLRSELWINDNAIQFVWEFFSNLFSENLGKIEISNSIPDDGSSTEKNNESNTVVQIERSEALTCKRVYELALNIHIPVADLVTIMKDIGINKNAVATLTYEEINKVWDFFYSSLNRTDDNVESKDMINIGFIVQLGIYRGIPVEWQILDIKGGKALLLSRFVLDFREYNEDYSQVTWETCSIRHWLNDRFYNKVFKNIPANIFVEHNVLAQRNPQTDIDPGNDTVDIIFFLSIDEVLEYLEMAEDRVCCSLETPEDIVWWWLRSPGDQAYYAACINDSGSVFYHGDFVSDKRMGIRPACWVNLTELRKFVK